MHLAHRGGSKIGVLHLTRQFRFVFDQPLDLPKNIFRLSQTFFLIRVDKDEFDQPAEGRVIEFFAFRYLLLVEMPVIRRGRKPDRGLLRHVGLKNDLAAAAQPAGSARHLREQLKRPFTCPKIRNMQPDVRQDHADQGHVFYIQPFGDDLRSYQDINTAILEFAVDLFEAELVPGTVPVRPRHSGVREQFLHVFLNLLRTDAEETDIDGLTIGTGCRNLLQTAAVVTQQIRPSRAFFMKGEGYVTIFTLGGKAARPAGEGGEEPPLVQEQNNLFFMRQGILHPAHQPARKNGAVTAREFRAQVDNMSGNRHGSYFFRKVPDHYSYCNTTSIFW